MSEPTPGEILLEDHLVPMGISPNAQFWFNIQTACDFRHLRKKEKKITAAITKNYTDLAA